MYKKGRKKGTVRFTIKPLRGTRKVLLAGDFNNWNPVAMKKQKDGSFATDVAVPAGIYEYKFVVDEQWVTDPDNSDQAPSPLGTMNSVADLG